VADGGNVIHFNKKSYEDLIRFIDEVNSDLEKLFLKAQATMSLDGSLGDSLRPGSPGWTVIKRLKDAATAFGNSVHEKFTNLNGEWTQYVTALKSAIDFFEKHDDLATSSAQDFLTDHPDLGNLGGGGGGGGRGGGGSTGGASP